MLSYETNVQLAPLTTFHVGGPARYLVRVERADALADAFSFARDKQLPVFVLGDGSNILVADHGFDGVVVKMEIHGIDFAENKNGTVEVSVGAGENWDDFVAETIRRGLYGLENLSGIPGTVGAAPIQNIGAYGAEVKDTIRFVHVFNPDTQQENILTNEECDFAYRSSMFKTPEEKRLVVTRVVFTLAQNELLNTSYKDVDRYFKEHGGKPTLASVRAAVLSIRSKKFPDIKNTGTAGSFFKNPVVSAQKARELKARFPDLPHFQAEHGVKIPIAWILDNALSWKGKRDGAAGTFSRHSLVLVNYGGATAADIDAFAKKIEHDVKEKTGIVLEREVTMV